MNVVSLHTRHTGRSGWGFSGKLSVGAKQAVKAQAERFEYPAMRTVQVSLDTSALAASTVFRGASSWTSASTLAPPSGRSTSRPVPASLASPTRSSRSSSTSLSGEHRRGRRRADHMHGLPEADGHGARTHRVQRRDRSGGNGVRASPSWRQRRHHRGSTCRVVAAAALQSVLWAHRSRRGRVVGRHHRPDPAARSGRRFIGLTNSSAAPTSATWLLCHRR